MSNILIIRLSAMGDVAMTIPVIYSVAKANPEDSFTTLTQTKLMPLFMNRPVNVSVIGVNLQNAEKSLAGFLLYLFKRRHSFDKIVDLHGSLRTLAANFVFKLWGKPVFRIDKQRKQRRRLTARPPKTIQALRPVVERYADVFRAAGCRLADELPFVSLYEDYANDERTTFSLPFETNEVQNRLIGIAPFARHKGKIYPQEKMEQVVAALSQMDGITLLLFGGKNSEQIVLERWAEQYDHTISVAGRYTLDAELSLLSRLDALVSMDSSNMHLASLVGVKVISIWGATHPYAGFYGYRQNAELAMQAALPCRPCSIYGNKPCYRNDYECLHAISPSDIIRKIMYEVM